MIVLISGGGVIFIAVVGKDLII